MTTPLRLLFQIALLLPTAALTAQNDEPQKLLPPRGGERLLRQCYIAPTPLGARQPGSVTLTYGSRVSTLDELARVTRAGARWHVGGDVWPILQTSHSLRFEADAVMAGPPDTPAADPARFQLDPGRYVVTAQVGRERRHLVFTPAALVEARAPDAGDPDALLGLGGVYVPAEQLEHDHAIGIPAARLMTHEPDGPTGSLELQLGAISFTADFRLLVRSGLVPEPGAAARRRLLPRLVEAALTGVPGQLELVTLRPDARVEDADGRPRSDEQHFHGYPVIGRRRLDMTVEAEREAATTLQGLLRESALAHTDQTVADCFEPRFGLRVRAPGGAVDFVVSFACEQALAFHGDRQLDTLLVVGTWAPRFAAQCRALGLRHAD